MVKNKRVPKNGRKQGERGKMSKGAGSTDPPPNRASAVHTTSMASDFW